MRVVHQHGSALSLLYIAQAIYISLDRFLDKQCSYIKYSV